MPTPTMEKLYHYRVTLLVGAVLGFGIVLWLLIGEVLQHVGRRWATFQQLKREYGNWFAPDHGVNGLLGIRLSGFGAHVVFDVVGLALFAGVTIAFIAPRRDWGRLMTSMGRLPRSTTAAGALIAGLVTVGFAAVGMELAGWWGRGHWPVGVLRTSHLSIDPTFWFALVLLVIASTAWYFKLRRPRRGRDRLIRMIVVTYYLFLGGALLLLTFAVLLFFEVYTLAVEDGTTGILTGGRIGFGAMLWTAVPSLVLIYRGERYRRLRDGLCLVCAYDLRATAGPACPECGAKIDRTR